MADLGPGTMPRGKYPESPAPAGSHALISRTPPPGGMLHANLGLPRPPPRNFQPPLPQQALKTNSNSAPIKPVSFPSSGRVKQSPQTKNPSCRHSVAACVSDHSRGQHMLPQQLPVQPQKNPPIPLTPPSCCRSRGGMRGWPHAPATTLKTNGVRTAPNGRSSTRPAQRIKSPNPPTPRAVTLRRHPPNIVIPEFSAWLTLVLERCARKISGMRQRAPTPLFPERRPREACSMPISGCHDLPLATFNLPSRPSRLSPRRMSETTLGRILSHALPWSSPRPRKPPQSKRQHSPHRHSGISAARRACLPIGENAKRRFAGHSATDADVLARRGGRGGKEGGFFPTILLKN